MFSKILIANRGEIACRVIKTAQRMGVRTVAVFSDADRDALHVQLADEAIYIGPAPARESYLRTDKIMAAALASGAQAIHPGYGFLSENAGFSRLCEENGIAFIGPPASAIEAMGSKSAAKQIMEEAGVPLVPGYHGDDQDTELLRQAAQRIGYPVLLKAAAGGGGKGMRQVWEPSEFDAALAAAKREAMSSFNDDIMLVEKYLTRPRHVEIQVFCDSHGNGVYLFERDCSLQRRHQKVVEEAPAPGLPDEIREAMGKAALRAAQAIDYVGAGTVEFLFDEDGSFYFMEMNTRLQVEHPVTEMITRQDLVEWQLRVAYGETLPLQQADLRIHGHALEVRIYAEDPNNDFLPATGTLRYLQPPGESQHVRVDTGVQQGDEVSIYYDPMIAKLIVWDENRDRALNRLAEALTNYHISGVTTNLELLYNIAASDAFRSAELDTGFIEKNREALFPAESADKSRHLPAIALYLMLRQQQQARAASNPDDPLSPWNRANSWRLNEPHGQTLEISIEGETFAVRCEEQRQGDHSYSVRFGEQQSRATGELQGNVLNATIDGHRQRYTVVPHDGSFTLFTGREALHFEPVVANFDTEDSGSAGNLTAPMNGTLVELSVQPGQTVKKGDTLLIMEAMKMEYRIKAPADGAVSEFFYAAGDLIDGGAELLVFKAAE
ncbi:MAG: acetyl/propionyl/methylcrotonyl-CoA carboxylase subunit alpha [Gammaproteobacteria bacterium]|nr:acetyl/propionyl/methylcrotonyl-CoA carboxylase subunit alpha [Gammaproteobacteria bacterium]